MLPLLSNCHYWTGPRIEQTSPQESTADSTPGKAATGPAEVNWVFRPMLPALTRLQALPTPPTVRVRVGPDRAAVVLSTSGPYQVQLDGRTILKADQPLPPTTFARRGGIWHLGRTTGSGKTLTLAALQDATLRLDRTAYRGCLYLHAIGPATFLCVNHVDLENYLAGVLARELFETWHAETYRALAVAARTYAYYESTANAKDGPYDVWDSQASQVYGGLSAETARSRAAARSTCGLMLVTGLPGKQQVFRAYYSSCCGGRTNPAEVLLGQNPAAPPLRGGLVCNDCKSATYYRWPAVRLSKRGLYPALVASFPAVRTIGGLQSVRVYSTNRYGRAVWLELQGPKGKTIRILADDVRIAALRADLPGADKLFSMNCTILDNPTTIEFRDGQGFGHGVGLCQWGAQGKALAGWPAEKILLFYYPGADIVRLY